MGLSKVTDILSGRSDILLMEALTLNLLYVMWIGLLNPGFYASERQVFTF